ncbi:hypothetical protein LXL04_039054 [Taraxacum kok-saghyz]
MSQTRARAFQTVKSVNYYYKVCSTTNASRSYCSSSSFKAHPFVKEISTLSSAAKNVSSDFRNPNEFPGAGTNYNGYGKDWSTESKSEYERHRKQLYNLNGNYPYNIMDHSSNRLSEEGRSVKGGGNDQYLKNNVIFQENQGNYYMREDDLHRQSQYNVNGSYSGNASSNQQSSVKNYQYNVTGSSSSDASSYQQSIVVNDQLPNGSCSDMVNSQLQAVDERRLLGTIQELDAFCKNGKLKEAVEVLDLLEQNKVSVDIPRYLFLMKACGESQALTAAKHVHNHLTRSVPHLNVSIYNKILEMYSNCGSMEDAYKVFDKMPQRNLSSWDTMITGLAKNGHGEDAIEMFTEFKTTGLKPDNEIFHGVFLACSVIGDMREGLLHFDSMIKAFNLVPSMDHYTSVVNMLGSAGYLNEALEFIEKMNIKPNVEICEIMMNQSRVHGDLQLGDRFAEILNLLDPSRLDEQSKKGLIPIKPSDIAKEKEKNKLFGDDHLKKKTQVYQFSAGDISHPDREKLYSQLRCLKHPMKEAGYVPDTRFCLHDLDEESKEEALLSHSERLAISQSLLTSPARSPIRIIKNLRVCGDCHSALKFISKVVGRSIIARDAKRFHHFENGVCSCGDYW